MSIPSIEQLVGSPQVVLPSEITGLIQAWIEGRVKQIAIATELEDGSVYTFHKAIEGGACVYKMIGMVSLLHDDILSNLRDGHY